MRTDKKKRNLGFFAMLLALLGISGCQSLDDGFDGMRLMYGTPTAHYTVKGKVTNDQGQPIPDINVTFYGIYYGSPNTPAGVDPFGINLKTDKNGNYLLDSQHMPYPQIRVQFDDTDGPANGGEFESGNTLVDIKFEKNKKDKNPWNSGEAKVNVATFKMKKK